MRIFSANPPKCANDYPPVPTKKSPAAVSASSTFASISAPISSITPRSVVSRQTRAAAGICVARGWIQTLRHGQKSQWPPRSRVEAARSSSLHGGKHTFSNPAWRRCTKRLRHSSRRQTTYLVFMPSPVFEFRRAVHDSPLVIYHTTENLPIRSTENTPPPPPHPRFSGLYLCFSLLHGLAAGCAISRRKRK